MLLPHQRRPQWIAGVLLAWTAVGLFFFTQDLLRNLMFRDPTPWWHLLVSWLVGVYISAALTPVMLWLGRRFPLERKRWVRRVALHLWFSVALAIVHLVVDSAIVHRLGLFPAVMKSYSATFVILMVFGFHGNITGYWIVLGIQAAFGYYHQYHERRQTARCCRWRRCGGEGASWRRCQRRRCQPKREESLPLPPPRPVCAASAAAVFTTPASLVALSMVFGSLPNRSPPLAVVPKPRQPAPQADLPLSDQAGRRSQSGIQAVIVTGGCQPPTNGKAGGKHPAGKIAARSPARSFSAASR